MSKKYPTMKRGWYNNRPNSNPEFESYRHRLARYGIRTAGMSNNEIKQKHELLMKKLDKEENKRFVDDGNVRTQITNDNLVNYLMQHEGGELTNEEFFELFGYLVKTGKAWKLQGHYGRQARRLLDMDYINPNGSVNWNKIKSDGINLKEVR